MSSEEYKQEEEIAAAATMDTMIEIMKRLPIKSLIKFLSVSKQWKSVIQSSLFIAYYNRSHIQLPNHLFVFSDSENFVDILNDANGFLQHITVPMSAHLMDFKFSRLIGCSQGLFGFRCYNPKDVYSVVVIWNPSIRKSVFIPLPEDGCFETVDYGFTVCNATDPTISKITYNTPELQVQIFTLTTGVWRTFYIVPPRESIEFIRGMVAIDRFIHWIAYEGDRYLILSFDITSEQFTESCLPLPHTHPSRFRLGLSKHKESLVVLERDENEQEIGVWMMGSSVQNSFAKLFTVKVPYPSIPELEVLGFPDYGQPIFQMYAYPSTWTLVFYEPDSKCFKILGFLETSIHVLQVHTWKHYCCLTTEISYVVSDIHLLGPKVRAKCGT